MKYKKTEVIQLKSQIFEHYGVNLFVKREDQNHPTVSGNKWWKLKYNLSEAIRTGKDVILTFGGAYSNHIYATAAAANELGLRSIGVIRGEQTLPLNTTLTFASNQGMEIYYVDRTTYREKSDPELIHNLQHKFGDFYLIPEGGTNEFAVSGCKEFAQQLQEEIHFDYLALPVGTGGTLSGMAEGLPDSKKIIGFASLKGAQFLEAEVRKLTSKTNWQLIYDYHFGGYAKTTTALNDFIKQFENEHNIPVDPIYTAKAFFGVMDLIKKDFFKRGTTILLVHTGGLQGKNISYE